MKKILILFISLFSIISCFSQKIEINNAGFFINSTKITKETNPIIIKNILGEPNEIHLAKNTIWTYENLGILIYISPETNEIAQITLELVNQNYNFSASHPFKGELIILGVNIYKETTLLSIKKNIKQLKIKENPYSCYSAVISYMELYLHLPNSENILNEFSVSFN